MEATETNPLAGESIIASRNWWVGAMSRSLQTEMGRSSSNPSGPGAAPSHPPLGSDEWKILERMKEDERTGALYATNVEIAFPPQVKDDTGRDGLIVDIREILHDQADLADREGETVSAAALRYIADKYYPEDDEEFDDLEELDDEDDQDGAG